METERYSFKDKYTTNGLKIIYEDNHLISVIKPLGVLSQADGSDLPDLVTMLKTDIAERAGKKGDAFVALLHRLDTNTCGTIVFGKTSKGASRVSEQIRVRSFYKGYFAVVRGSVKASSGTLVNYLSKDEKNNKVYEAKNGRECLLYYEKIAENDGKTLVCAYPITGRTHQIRAQFALAGHPLCGDVKYGGGKSKEYFSLWSCMCGFRHPTKEINLLLTSKPDKYGDFTAFNESFYDDYLAGMTFDKLERIKKGGRDDK